ncbi:MAG: nucleotidyltransferase family protein, partial [Bacteroidia bacterium]
GKVMNRQPVTIKEGEDELLKDLMINKEIQTIPVINESGKIIDVKYWHKLFSRPQVQYTQVNAPLVIMAGGQGSRLEPFTKVLPKPLIPINDNTILEVILNEYLKFGISQVYLTVNYKANMIRSYFEYSKIKYNIEFVEESKPLGTAGALNLLKGKIKTPFFVSNCDIIIHEDYSKIYDFHVQGKFDLTLVASVQHHTIPYGVCKIKNGGELDEIIEKPEYDFFVNTGMYVLNPETLDLIPEDTFFHITHLIALMQKKGKKLGVYPVSEKSWTDVGQWHEYQKAISFFKDLS